MPEEKESPETPATTETQEARIPYERFQKVTEEKNKLSAELEKVQAVQREAEAKKLAETQEFQKLAELKSQEAEAFKRQLDDVQKSTKETRIRYELELMAQKAGAIDTKDLIKLADISAVNIDDTGAVIGADKLIENIKKEKPYLFSSAQPAPGVHTDRAGSNKRVWTRTELLKDGNAAKDMYQNNRAEYNRIVYGK
jgi:hypothetical protein